jgi:hypothetical protein
MTEVNIDQMAACLHALTQPNTDTIRQAELQLKPVLKNPANMPVLWRIITGNYDIAVRHVAAIVLRKRLPGHYSQWDPAGREQWQRQVLQALATETVRPVRAGLLGVAAAIAQHHTTAPPQILQFLAAAVNDPSPDARELCFLLLLEMTDTVGTHWKEHVNDLVHLFSTTLHSTHEPPAVHKAAVQAVGQLMSFWADEPEMEYLAPLLPTVLHVAGLSNDEDLLSAVLDVLYELAYSPAGALQAHMELTVEFSLRCLQNRDLELRVRDAAALVIATTGESKPKSFGKHRAMLGAVLDTLFQLMQDSQESAAGALFESNPAWREDLDHHTDDDLDDPDSPTETSMAQGTLDMMACEIPKKYIWEPLLQRCISRMSDAGNSQARKAGVAGLGVIAEGCCEPLTAALHQVLPYVFASAQDAAPAVRECACFCLGQLSEHCQPDILQYSTQILPIVFSLLDDGSVAVQATSCYVLEMFCERLEPAAVRPLLDSLVRKLASMLEATTKRSVQEMAVAALAATAVAAEEEFTPYVQGVATLMTKLMQIQDPDRFSLRGRALECMGHMGIAVGCETFRPYFTATMQCAMEGLTTDSTELQEFAYAVFANLAKVMKEEFAPALNDLVPYLIKVIDQDEGQLEATQRDDEEGAFAALDDSDDDNEDGNYVLHVRTALLDVKKGAITALGEMAAHTGTSFCPHLEASMQVLQKAATNWHPLVKSEVADAFPSLIVPSIAAYHNGEIEWKKGDIDASPPLSAHTAALVGAVLQEELTLLQNDDDKNTATKACEAVQTVLELCGPHALAPVADTVLATVLDILLKQAPCQTADAMYGEVPDEDDDHDGLMQSACDLIGALGRVMGAHLANFLPQLLPAICEYAKSSRPPSDRSMAVGCLSEIAQEVPISGEYWKSVFLPAILAGLSDEDDNVKRNAAFCAGVSCEQLGTNVGSDYAGILPLLGNILARQDVGEVTESVGACKDNAAAAVARMIMASPAHVPLPQVLPVFLRALPLKHDMTENETVYKCVLGLLQMQPGQVDSNEVKRIFTAALAAEDSSLSDEWKGKLQGALQGL